ncbi:hemerythrin domain-containing protein [Planotetraspora sp. A-T 1434]|uniref:hemerythrin domain-containing protein n=1 Tax=Planotetraspora sp. A-T 1434 TaxID=2979219 RepID=UPI0021BF5A53|nr:hemerythrin domain-containing protein [Planotetraspora sp. A-T 1434]MCT9932207.1 hemerythrin domain-containing protein [Planotetraspora sp. A-T 1434]
MTDVISMIKTDHREVEALFDRLKKDVENRPALLAELAAKFVAHSRAEEDLVYPEIAKTVPEEKDEVHEGAEEHHQAERILLQLLDAKADDKNFDRLLQECAQAINHHVQEEENKILPGFAKAVPGQRLTELGRAFSEHKARDLVISVMSAGGPKKGKAKSGRGGQDVSEMSREELYQRAQEADIPGRSGMSKKQLAEALQKGGKR